MAEKTISAESGRKVQTDAVQENEMGTLPIGKLLRRMSLPLIISMLVQVLYGLVDSMYVARLGDLALTAISLCMPVQYLAVAIGTGDGQFYHCGATGGIFAAFRLAVIFIGQ